MPEPHADAVLRRSPRLEVRTPRGAHLRIVSPRGVGAPRTLGVAERPDVVLIAEEVALAAVLDGRISPRTAATEGQVELLGDPEAIDRLERLLRAGMAA
jgi:hypothetical protein